MSGRVLPCSPQEIASLFLFEKLSPEQLGRLCAEALRADERAFEMHAQHPRAAARALGDLA